MGDAARAVHISRCYCRLCSSPARVHEAFWGWQKSAGKPVRRSTGHIAQMGKSFVLRKKPRIF